MGAAMASYLSLKRDTYGDVHTAAFGWSWKRAEQGYIWGIFIVLGLFVCVLGVQAIKEILSQGPHILRATLLLCMAVSVLFGPNLWRPHDSDQNTEERAPWTLQIANWKAASYRAALFVLLYVCISVLYLHYVGAFFYVTGTVVQLTLWLTGIFMYALLGGLLGGIRLNHTIEVASAPNGGIWTTLRYSALTSATFFGFGMAYEGILIFLKNKQDYTSMISDTLVIAVLACFFGLWHGAAVMRHFFLRAILSFLGHTPPNYVKFLDHATSLVFLQKVGGGYIFIHRLVMEHFASLNEEVREQLSSSPAAEMVQERVNVLEG
jgi:hypothetical protein